MNEATTAQETINAEETTEAVETPETEELTFTKAQQAEIDRKITEAVANALARRDKAHEKSQIEAVKAAREDERKKLAMTAEQRFTAEQEERKKALDEREQALNLREFKGAVIEKLAQNSLPLNLADLLATSCDDESVDTTIKTLRATIDSEVNAALKNKATQREPKASRAFSDAASPELEDELARFGNEIRKVK